MENNKIDITENLTKYCTNHPSQRRAAKKYYEDHKEDIYQKLKEKINNDPDFKQKRLEYARRSRERKKLKNLQEQHNLSSPLQQYLHADTLLSDSQTDTSYSSQTDSSNE
jgi:hypothetical protein